MGSPNQDAAPQPDLKETSHPEPPQASPGSAAFSPVRIPKKNQPSIEASGSTDLKSSVNSFDANSMFDLKSLNLPPGVELPEQMDNRLRRSLGELSPDQMREVLIEYCEAVKERGKEIRSKAAYLFGVIKRYKSQRDFGGSTVPQGGNLSSPIQARLNALVASGFCTNEELDRKIKDRLSMLPKQDALGAIAEMSGCSRKEIRNFSSYFMGIMNRYMRGERQNPHTRDSNHNNHLNNNNRDGNRYDDDRSRNSHRDSNNMGSDNRFSHYGRNDNQSSSHPDRNDGRDGRDKRSSRDSDREHYRSRRRRSRSRSYDSRSRSRSRSPERRRRRSRSRSRSDSRERYRSRRRDHSRASHRDSNKSSKAYQQNQPAPPIPHLVPPPPPPRLPNMMQPMEYLGQPPPQQMIRPMQPPGQFMQPIGQIPQIFLQQPPPQLLQQQFQQSIPGSMGFMQSTGSGKMMMPGSQAADLTNLLLQPPVDIMGLAEKAAQALGLPPGPNTQGNPNFPPPSAAFSQPQQNLATGEDLPMMVQYAVQNLCTTGHIERALDPPVCAMLKRLPESAALQSLEIFSSCDLSKMRNKSAYLSGILRKELIKLGLH